VRIGDTEKVVENVPKPQPARLPEKEPVPAKEPEREPVLVPLRKKQC
jgi:hypothetical protein